MTNKHLLAYSLPISNCEGGTFPEEMTCARMDFRWVNGYNNPDLSSRYLLQNSVARLRSRWLRWISWNKWSDQTSTLTLHGNDGQEFWVQIYDSLRILVLLRLDNPVCFTPSTPPTTTDIATTTTNIFHLIAVFYHNVLDWIAPFVKVELM